jgi:imidazolonepropionase-like amidohydrolase
MILKNCCVFDGVSEVIEYGRHLFIEDGVIRDISRKAAWKSEQQIIDLKDRFLMPGLIDAHFHAYGADININHIDQMVPSLRALYARRNLEDALLRGFTTVRDAAGADIGLVMGVERGLISGPRIFHSGLAISQTGGHGDMRAPSLHVACGCDYTGSLSVVADGVDMVRRAARDQLRRGATQIKLFVSGGVLSPSDPLWMNQFTDEEIAAAVHEAESRRTYVMAHAHTNEAVMRCLRNGVRSIEHATILDATTASAIAERGAFAVPTLAIIYAVRESAATLGLAPVMISKMHEVEQYALTSLDRLRSAGAQIGFGSDLFGSTMHLQSREFVLRTAVCKPIEILRSARPDRTSRGRLADRFIARRRYPTFGAHLVLWASILFSSL